MEKCSLGIFLNISFCIPQIKKIIHFWSNMNMSTIHNKSNFIFVNHSYQPCSFWRASQKSNSSIWIYIYSVCTWPKYMITSEFFNEWKILCIIFEQLLPAHIPSLQIPTWLNSLLRALQCFFESDLREHVHEGTIPNGRRLIQVFQLDCITKERKKY